MVNVPSDLLKAASPKAFDLNAGTKVDMTHFFEVTSNCRNYTEYAGLRQLQALYPNRTAKEPGCGWILTPLGGGRGAYGVEGVPTLFSNGEPDIIRDGNIFIKDLVEAERLAVRNITSRETNPIDTCAKMNTLPAHTKPFIGYCKSSQNVIPIITTDNGQTIRPRFSNDVIYKCAASNIVPSSNISLCPPEPFKNYRNISSRTFDRVDGFTDTSFFDTCSDTLPSSPEWGDCVRDAVKAAGCREKGTLYRDPTGQTAAYGRAFGILSNPPMNTIDNVFLTVNTKIAGVVPTNPRQSAAIQELCFQQNYLQENYNWCADYPNTTIITATNFECIQNIWRNEYATTTGISAPSLTKWQGKLFSDFRTYATNLKNNTTQINKDKQVLAISRTIGTPTYGQTYSATPNTRIDCVTSQWSGWSACPSVGCGASSQQTRTRSIITQASGGGTACPSNAELIERRDCPVSSCTPVDCEGQWPANWNPASCELATRDLPFGTSNVRLRKDYTVIRQAANGGRADTCPAVRTIFSNCPVVGCPTYSIGSPVITTNANILSNGFNFAWLGDYELFRIRSDQANAVPPGKIGYI
jgi:hypothetical protein